jgi:hypothetical protein
VLSSYRNDYDQGEQGAGANSMTRIANRQSPIANRQSPIANRQSPIANRQSPIANRQSPIANRQSPIADRQYSHERARYMNFLKNLLGSKPNPITAKKKLPPPGKHASAYRFPDRTVLHSQARTPGWTLIACEPYLTLPQVAAVEDIGRAVQAVIAGYRAEEPETLDWKQVTAAFVRGLGAKSHKQLQESSICCGIVERDGQLNFQPYHNGGTSGDTKGFQPISGAQLSLAADSAPAEIGAALIRCFALCTTIYDRA